MNPAEYAKRYKEGGDESDNDEEGILLGGTQIVCGEFEEREDEGGCAVLKSSGRVREVREDLTSKILHRRRELSENLVSRYVSLYTGSFGGGLTL